MSARLWHEKTEALRTGKEMRDRRKCARPSQWNLLVMGNTVSLLSLIDGLRESLWQIYYRVILQRVQMQFERCEYAYVING
jgi:hypothetical protein